MLPSRGSANGGNGPSVAVMPIRKSLNCTKILNFNLRARGEARRHLGWPSSRHDLYWDTDPSRRHDRPFDLSCAGLPYCATSRRRSQHRMALRFFHNSREVRRATGHVEILSSALERPVCRTYRIQIAEPRLHVGPQQTENCVP